jgi:hypothetical protein
MFICIRGLDTPWPAAIRRALGLIALGGLVLRVTYVLVVRDQSVVGDGNYYHAGANYLFEGLGFLNPVTYFITGNVTPGANRPPAWTVSLAGPSLVGLDSVLQHQLFACVVDAATLILVGIAGRAVGGPRVGMLTAAIAQMGSLAVDAEPQRHVLDPEHPLKWAVRSERSPGSSSRERDGRHSASQLRGRLFRRCVARGTRCWSVNADWVPDRTVRGCFRRRRNSWPVTALGTAG